MLLLLCNHVTDMEPVAAKLLPRRCRVATMSLPCSCRYHIAAILLPYCCHAVVICPWCCCYYCRNHVTGMLLPLPCCCHTAAMLPYCCRCHHVTAMLQPLPCSYRCHAPAAAMLLPMPCSMLCCFHAAVMLPCCWHRVTSILLPTPCSWHVAGMKLPCRESHCRVVVMLLPLPYRRCSCRNAAGRHAGIWVRMGGGLSVGCRLRR